MSLPCGGSSQRAGLKQRQAKCYAIPARGRDRETDLMSVMADNKADKIWAAAVRRAVMRRMENEEGKPQKIERLADQLVEFALDGQGWAMQEIGNRLDGKPAQQNIIQGDPDNPISHVHTIERVLVKPDERKA